MSFKSIPVDAGMETELTKGDNFDGSRQIADNNIDTVETRGGSAFAGCIHNNVDRGGAVYYAPVYYSQLETIQNDSNTASPMFLVPIKPSNRFVSRDDILKKMEAAIHDNRSKDLHMPVALKGIGGMGKSELMLNYCYQHRRDYDYVFWLRVDGSKATLDAFRGLAKELGIDIKADESESDNEMLIRRVRKWFESRTGWLLLLDNMDSVADVDPYIPATCGDVFVSTRNHIDSSWATVIPVDNMTNQEALLLLGAKPPYDDTKTLSARDIVQHLGCFPLAISLARSYIETTKISFTDYLKWIRQQPELLLTNRDDSGHKYKETVATVWNLSFNKIRERNSLATRILGILAFLQPDAIPVSFFERQYDTLELFREQTSKHPQPASEVLNAIGVLVEFSFVRRTTSEDNCDTIAIHRLVQTVVRGVSDSDENLRQLDYIVAALSREVVSEEYHDAQVRKTNEVHLPHVRHIVAQLKDPDRMTTGSEDLLMHLLQRTVLYLINSGTFQGTGELAQTTVSISKAIHGTEHPDTAKSINILAELYRKQGKYDEAEPLYQQALAIREKMLGPEHPDTATTLNNLAWLYFSQGKYDKAEPVYQRALAIFEINVGPEYATTLNNLAELYKEQGKYDEAEPLYQRAVATSNKMLGTEHPGTALTMDNLAGFYQRQGKYNEAELLYQKALAIRNKVLGPEHPHTALTLSNLAVLYKEQSKYNKAEPLYQRALATLKTTLGPEHPRTASILDSLAGFYQSQGKYDEAEQLYQQALVIREKVVGSEHTDTAKTLKNLALLYKEQSKYNKAEPLYQRALEICEKKFGQEHPRTASFLDDLAGLYQSQGKYGEAKLLYQQAATTLENLALLYKELGKYNKAESLYQRVLEICEKWFGQEHPYTASILDNLAGLYQSQGKYNEAELLHQKVLAIRERVLGSEHPGTASTLHNLAWLYFGQGKYDKAELLYQQALTIWEKVIGPEHMNKATTLNNLAMLYKKQGKYNMAEALYQRALAIYEKVLGPEHPHKVLTMENLAGLYQSQGKYDEAEPLFQQALKIHEVLGAERRESATTLNNLALLYRDQKKYDKAEPLFQRALAIYEKMLGPEHPNIATTLNNLAGLYHSQGKYDEAESLFQLALAIHEKVSGPESAATTMNNLAGLYFSQSRYNEAKSLFQQAQKMVGPEHLNTATDRNNLVILVRNESDESSAPTIKPIHWNGISKLLRKGWPKF